MNKKLDDYERKYLTSHYDPTKPFICMLITIAIILIIILSIYVISQRDLGKSLDNECQQLGFEDYESGNLPIGYGYCSDEEGNLHYVKVNVTGPLFNKKASVKLVSVGDNRMVPI